MLEYLNTQIIGQIIGFIALFFVFLGFKETDDRKLILYLTVGSFFWGIHFSILGLVAAAGINFFDIGKNLMGLKYENNKIFMGVFITCYIIIGMVSYTYTGNIFSLLPTLASVVSTVGVFIFRGIYLRLNLLGVLGIWFVYNFAGGSIPGITSDIVLIGATFYGIYKLTYKISHYKY